jgi:protein-disulfide isomerase
VSNEIHFYKYLGLKKNPDVLRALLAKQKHFGIPVSETSLVFGEKDRSLKIIAFLSLNCSHCARAFKKIKEIFKSENKIEINVVLITSDSKLLNVLYNLHQKI